MALTDESVMPFGKHKGDYIVCPTCGKYINVTGRNNA